MDTYERFAKRVTEKLKEKYPACITQMMKTRKMISVRDAGGCLIVKHSLERQYEQYLKGETSVKEVAGDIGKMYMLE